MNSTDAQLVSLHCIISIIIIIIVFVIIIIIIMSSSILCYWCPDTTYSRLFNFKNKFKTI